LSAAQRLAYKSGWVLSNLELQKILYLAHMFHLGRTGEPLVTGQFEAWDYGPVHPALYHRAKVFGADPVANVFHDIPEVPPGSERDILDEALTNLGKVGPGRLVHATHRPGGAWATFYIPGARGRAIPNEAILAEYRALRNANEAA
ncbi:MAG: SocA family protein, partial [Hyphomicrobiaceae bacterium]|nr:SocA family protein [Hyphomicrobiaceae bacterium]